MRLPEHGLPVRSLRLPVKAIISKCRSADFTGAVICASGYLNGTVLFSSGIPICAESDSTVGRQALRKLETSTLTVRADFHPISKTDIDTIALFNESMKVDEGKDEDGAKTTIKPVKIGRSTRTASIRVLKVDRPEEPRVCRAKEPSRAVEPGRKQVLNPSSIEALKKLSENFEANASDLLKEMNMEHLIVGDKKEEH